MKTHIQNMEILIVVISKCYTLISHNYQWEKQQRRRRHTHGKRFSVHGQKYVDPLLQSTRMYDPRQGHYPAAITASTVMEGFCTKNLKNLAAGFAAIQTQKHY